ncbi:MAG: DNA cytosine methyltransferase [Candidatus Viridilinea halotolerans]|uniref:Cytosine-specific methyltransferase n=1 Tax=Candidatus Viridilinea halotolerans TaxID=2491704 RepID=A0A426TWK1_9CHLR|nr:MAG: DNA cytosine methyltransferase [Candidatus Viridilinea halotolerans]
MSTEITVTEAVQILRVSEQRVRTLCREKILVARKVGATWLLDQQSVLQYGLRTGHKIAEDHPTYTLQKGKPSVLSFFSGALGMDLGLERAGFEVRLACEVDPYCRQTITLNRPNMALIGDITAYSPDEVLQFAGISRTDDIDLIVGGPPCQAFSTAGKRNGFNDQRGNVFLTYLDLVLNLKPKFFIIENVRGLLSCPMKHRPHTLRGPEYPDLTLDELPGGALYFILDTISKAGYAYSFNLYNAANFGTPQVRERVVIICSRDGRRPPYLQPTHAQDGAHGLPAWRTFRDATQGIASHHHINFPEKRLVFYRMLKEGQNWRALPEALQQAALGNAYFAGGGKTGFLRRLAWDRPAPTLVTHPAMPATDLAHPEENRPLSIEEYKRLQEFPDTWHVAGPLVEQYRQIGNAVPTSLGYAIGALILRLLNHEPIAEGSTRRYSRYRHTSDHEWLANFERVVVQRAVAQESLF